MAGDADASLWTVLVLAGVQLLLGALLVLRSFVLGVLGMPSLNAVLERRRRSSRAHGAAKGGEAEQAAADSDSSAELTEEMQMQIAAEEMLHDNLVSSGTLNTDDKSVLASVVRERKSHKAWQDSRRRAFELHHSIFCGHVRSEANFIRGNDDPELKLPPSSPMEIEPPYYTRWLLYSYLRLDHFIDIFCLSLGWAIIAGGFGSLVCWYHYADTKASKQWVEVTQGHMAQLMSDFKWLPTFMLVGHLGFFVQRWRQFIFAAWGVEGRLKDLGIILGADVKDPENREARRLMFKFYRYMVLAMALQYKSIIPSLRSTGDHLPRKLQDLGLLTEAEKRVLTPAGSRMRDTVLSWLALEANGNRGLLCGTNTIVVMEKLSALRAKMMYFHGNNFYPQPNLSSALMKMLVDLYCLLMVVCYPFKMLTPLPYTWLVGLQPLTILSVFLMTVCFWGAESLAYALATPFASRIDTFNIDALIAGTEQTLFASLRASFDNAARRGVFKD